MSEVDENLDEEILIKKVKKIVALAVLPFTTSNCFRYVNARNKKEKEIVTSTLEELNLSGEISYILHPGFKDRIIEKKTPATGEAIAFNGTSFENCGVTIFVGMGDLYDVSRVALISRLRGDKGGFQRAQEMSWIHELANAFGNTYPPLLFTSVVLYFNKNYVTLDDGVLNVYLDEESGPKGWIIDGQQRCYAAQEVRLRKALDDVKFGEQPMPCPIVVLIGDKDIGSVEEIDLLRTLFINANNTRPLPKNLVDELVGMLSNPEGMPLTKTRYNAYDPQQILLTLDKDPDSPIFDMIAFTSKTEGNHPYTMTVAKRNLNYVMKKVPVENADPLPAYVQILKDILAAIKDTWSGPEIDVFPDLLADPRAISPILVFLTDNLSSVAIFAAPNRSERLKALLIPIKPYLHLVKVGKNKWEEDGSWNPMQTTPTSKGIIEAALNLRKIYASVAPSNPIN
jgi:DGQHR domain-containing protein